MEKIRSKANAIAISDNFKQQEIETKFMSILNDMTRIKRDIGKSICELQKKEQEFTEAHKHAMEQIKESYNALDWISNLLLETGKANLKHKDSGNNQGLSPIIADIRKNKGYDTINNSEQQIGGNNGN